MLFRLLIVAALSFPSLCFAKEPRPLNPSIGKTYSRTLYDTAVEGSCVLIDENHVLTCMHLISDPTMQITLGKEKHTGTLVVVDFLRDWSIYRLARKSRHKPLVVAERTPANKSTLISFGHGKGVYGASVLVWENGELRGTIQQGDSGGPVLNSAGEVLSVNSAKRLDRPVVYAHGFGQLRPFVRKWTKSKKLFCVENHTFVSQPEVAGESVLKTARK